MNNLEYIKDIVKKNILAISSVAFGILSLVVSLGILYYNDKLVPKECEEVECPICDVTIEDSKLLFKVDIKGAVKSPGVYELKEGSTVDDAIKLSGGITSSGVTTNINLSKKVKDEMVIYVFTKKELEEKKSANEIVCEIPKCECETIVIEECSTSNTNNENRTEDKISINTATLEELTSLDGIGESKAQAIIDYRNTNGLFENLEDLTKVSGIGGSVYEKIKDKIKL